jgi:hypothetical protein
MTSPPTDLAAAWAVGNQVAITASVIGLLLLLIGVAAALLAVFRTTAQDKRIERLQSENTDYVRRLDYVEPRLHTLEQQNETLLRLHDPSADRAATKAEHEQILAVLNAQSDVLADLERNLEGRLR